MGCVTDSTCLMCRLVPETIKHLFRECPFAGCIWSAVSPCNCPLLHHVADFKDWLQANCVSGSSNFDYTKHWSTFFTFTLWTIWFSRNQFVHNSTQMNSQQIKSVILNGVQKFLKYNSPDITLRNKTMVHIGWSPPPPGFLKLNNDGFAQGNPGTSGARGIFRDHNGFWMYGYSRRVGFTTSFVAKLWAIRDGLDIVVHRGISKLILETNSKVAEILLQSTDHIFHSLGVLILDCRLLRNCSSTSEVKDLGPILTLFLPRSHSLVNDVVRGLSPLKEVRVRSESDIERELEFFEDPDYISPPTPCSESYEIDEMTSEETLSIGGSEEVRMLEYSDISVESGSSESERTEGGVVRNEVVEVRAERVPANILEVGDRNNKCYDSGADIVSEVKVYESELRSRDSLSHLVETYEISSRVLVRPVGVEERVCSAPQDHWMPVCAHYVAVGLRFPLPDLLVWLLLEYSVGLTQLSPNTVRVIIGFIVYCRARGVKVPTVSMFKHFFVLKAGSRKEKGWYYFTPRSSNKEKRNLFSAGPSSIKGWKEKFFFVDDTEWERGDGEVEFLSNWKAKKANKNKYSLNSDEEEEVEKLVRKEGDIVDIMFLTNLDVIEAVELYRPSSMSEAKMDKFLGVASGVAIPKKLRKKSKTFDNAASEKGDGNKEKAQMSSEGDEVVEFVPQPAPIELDPKLRETEVPTHGKGKAIVPTPALQSSIFGSNNFSVVKNFINAYVLEVDRHQAREKVLMYGGTSVVRHALETATWVNALAQEFMELMRERNSLSFDNIVNLYRMPTAILTFIDCRKKVKAEYPDVDITKITFGEQEEGVEENGESMSADFHLQIKLRWDHNEEERTVFPPNFDFEFVAVEEEEVEVESVEVEENQPPLQVEVHPIPSNEEQPPLSANQEPSQPPPPAE
ncbi:hypothetical protein SLEP1_g45942 [Rubroshorea leprosula]|uniref:Uncharacterized protein n=1 Tax=Rubroshorea leprosula TaxID=152421 RepID=A0AAV5LKR6_9ROSI|nr:hypothetical protein SLEP1_g45942 [Rubroshorea leprosula]